jgi:hypothetical protein
MLDIGGEGLRHAWESWQVEIDGQWAKGAQRTEDQQKT